MAVLHTENVEHPFNLIHTEVINCVIQLERLVSKTALYSRKKLLGKGYDLRFKKKKKKAIAYNVVHGYIN